MMILYMYPFFVLVYLVIMISENMAVCIYYGSSMIYKLNDKTPAEMNFGMMCFLSWCLAFMLLAYCTNFNALLFYL